MTKEKKMTLQTNIKIEKVCLIICCQTLLLPKRIVLYRAEMVETQGNSQILITIRDSLLKLELSCYDVIKYI